MPQQQGAPTDFGGRVISNPKGIKPQWDTEDTRTGDVPTKDAHFDISNPPADNDKANGGIYKPHPLEEHTEKPKQVRHPLGKAMPKTHASISDN